VRGFLDYVEIADHSRDLSRPACVAFPPFGDEVSALISSGSYRTNDRAFRVTNQEEGTTTIVYLQENRSLFVKAKDNLPNASSETRTAQKEVG